MVDGLPPSISGLPPMGDQPATQSTGSPGLAIAASAKVRQAIDILQSTVADLPDELKSAVTKAVGDLSSKFPAGGPASQAVDANALRQIVQDKTQSAGLDRLQAGMQGPGGGGPPGAGGPPPGAMPGPPPGM